MLGVLVLALLMIPIATEFGNDVYETRMQTVTEQTQSRHAVQTVVVEGSTGMPADFESPAYVRVQWQDGTQLRTAEAISPETVTAGAPLTIWLDNTGKVVSAPLTEVDAEVSGTAATWTLWTLSVVFGVLGALLVRRLLDRLRFRSWERELALLAHNDDGWANRHT
ncbi:MAG: hypothetical protein K0R68_204 [Mycobacterium sp.]|nr:hypothetical protein [Mycobacterium sp.]